MASFQFKIDRGLDVPISGHAEHTQHDAVGPSSVALQGADYLGLKPKLLVNAGDKVKLGDPLFACKHIPSLVFTSPGAGKVSHILHGKKRFLDAVVVDLDTQDPHGNSDDCVDIPQVDPNSLSSLSCDDAVEFLLKTGLWTSLRTRPYGSMADPKNPAKSIFVTAIDTRPLCIDPAVVMANAGDDTQEAWQIGLALLARVHEGSVHVCTAATPQAQNLKCDIESVSFHTFSGPHPAGLVGTHMHFIQPVSEACHHWYLGYQDVLQIGRTLIQRRINVQRYVTVAGPSINDPRILHTRAGANVHDIARAHIPDPKDSGPVRIISGSILDGSVVEGNIYHLRRHDMQISALGDSDTRDVLGWVRPYKDKFSSLNVHLSSLFGRGQRFSMTTSRNGSHRALVPVGQFEAVLPYDTLPTYLLKALLVGDTDRAVQLGALEMEEEDLALCSYVCFAKYEYGIALRDCLIKIAAGE